MFNADYDTTDIEKFLEVMNKHGYEISGTDQVDQADRRIMMEMAERISILEERNNILTERMEMRKIK